MDRRKAKIPPEQRGILDAETISEISSMSIDRLIERCIAAEAKIKACEKHGELEYYDLSNKVDILESALREIAEMESTALAWGYGKHIAKRALEGSDGT